MLSLGGPVAMQFMASRKEMKREYDRLMNETIRIGTIMPWERTGQAIAPEIVELSSDKLWTARYYVLSILMPALDKAYWSGDQVTTQRDSTVAILAMHVFKRQNGRWPSTLDELTPRWSPTVPVDMFTGKPLIYFAPVQAGEQPMLYSVGNDLVDDGGVQPSNERFMGGSPAITASTKSAEPGDWVFWPVPQPKPRKIEQER